MIASKWFSSAANGRIEKDVLADLEGRLDIEGEPGHDTEGAEVDDRAPESVAVGEARQGDEVAIALDELDRGDGDREVAERSGAVRGGGAGARNRDMRQRCQIVERVALLVEIGPELAVADAALDRHLAVGGVEEQDAIEAFERNMGAGRIGDVVEAVARADDPHFIGGSYSLLRLLDRGGNEEPIGTVDEVSGPIGSGF